MLNSRLILLIAVLALNCKDNATQVVTAPIPPKGIAFERINTAMFVIKNDTNLVITDSTAWNNLYRDYWVLKTYPIPAVNFDSDQVVAIFFHGRSGCGFNGGTIDTVQLVNDTVEVFFSYPQAYGPCQAYFYPNYIAKFKHQNFPVEFVWH